MSSLPYTAPADFSLAAAQITTWRLHASQLKEQTPKPNGRYSQHASPSIPSQHRSRYTAANQQTSWPLLRILRLSVDDDARDCANSHYLPRTITASAELAGQYCGQDQNRDRQAGPTKIIWKIFCRYATEIVAQNNSSQPTASCVM